MPSGESSAPMPTIHLSSAQVEQIRQAPIFPVLGELTKAAREAKILALPEYKKLIAYLLEQADSRDRREPWTQRSGVARPVPKLRISLEKTFGVYADLHWFTLNKITNNSGQPLVGLFQRMAASLSRVKEEDFAQVMAALSSTNPDAALLRLLQHQQGRVKGFGVELFSRLAFALRRDLYFVLPKPWADTSGTMEYLGEDLRKYIGFCRNLRNVCDEVGMDEEIRASLLLDLLDRPKPPADLLETLHRAMGHTLARFTGLKADAAYSPKRPEEDDSTMPQEFAMAAIRARRGLKQLRDQLCKLYQNRCAISGSPVLDLLEVAYLVPYPTGNVHEPANAILIRTDIHTLLDCNLIGIEPKTKTVVIAPPLKGTSYAQLHGRPVAVRKDQSTVDQDILEERWRLFMLAHPAAGRDEREAGDSKTTPGRERPEVVTRPSAVESLNQNESESARRDDANRKDPERHSASAGDG